MWIAGSALLGCAKQICPAGDLACLTDSLQLFATDTGRLKLYPVDTELLKAAQIASLGDGGSNANQALRITRFSGTAGQLLTLDSGGGGGDFTVDWTDPMSCRPALCMAPCPKNARCLSSSRCGPPVRDGLASGSSSYRVEFAKQPAEAVELNFVLSAVSAAGCPEDVTAAILAGEALIGAPLVIAVTLPVPGGGSGAAADGGGGTGCAVTRAQCCSNGASLCGVPRSTCDECPAGTRKGIVCEAGSPCNTQGGFTAGSRLCHCD
jgi:hypothetical protein